MATKKLPESTKEQIIDLVKGLGKRKQAPHFTQFAEEVINTWGGSQKLAEDLKSIYDDSKNPAMKASILRAIVRMVERNTAMGGSEDDLGAMTEEDLESQALALLRKASDGRANNRVPQPSHRARGIPAAEDPSRPGGAKAGGAKAVRPPAEPTQLPHEPSP